jgi:hypothetical protein
VCLYETIRTRKASPRNNDEATRRSSTLLTLEESAAPSLMRQRWLAFFNADFVDNPASLNVERVEQTATALLTF